MDILTYDVECFNDTKAFEYINLKIYINNKQDGYGLVRYVSEESLKKYFPNETYDFIHKDDLKYIDIEKVNKDDLKKFDLPNDWNTYNKERRIKFFNSEYGKTYNMFKNYFLNKPAFYYVNLFKKEDKINSHFVTEYGLQKEAIGISDVDYNNTGLGKFLYLKMANILSEKNLNLVSAQTLSNDSQRMWKSLIKNYEKNVTVHRKRCYFNGDNIKVLIPEWCQVEEGLSFKI